MKRYIMLYLFFCAASSLGMDGNSKGLKRIPDLKLSGDEKKAKASISQPLKPSEGATLVPRLLAVIRAAIKSQPIGKTPQYNSQDPVLIVVRDLLLHYREKFKFKIDLEVVRLRPEPLTNSIFNAPSTPSQELIPYTTGLIIEELKISVPRLQTVQFATTVSNGAGFVSTNIISLNPSHLLSSKKFQQFIILHETGHVEHGDTQEGWDYESKLGKYAETNSDLPKLMRTHEISADIFAFSQGPQICQGGIEFVNNAIQQRTIDATTDTKTHPSMEKRLLIARIFLEMHQNNMFEQI